MRNVVFSIVGLLIITISCKSSSKDIVQVKYPKDCKYYRIISPEQVSWSTYYIKEVDKKFNQVRYCTFNPSVLGLIMYEKFGKWDGIYINKTDKSVKLIWRKKYIPGISKMISIGTTSYYDAFSSAIAYDSSDNDILTETSENREALLSFFEDNINAYDPKLITDFYTLRRETLSIASKEFHNNK